MKRVHITREGREYGTFLNLEGNFEQKLGSKGWLSSYLSCGFLTQLIQVYCVVLMSFPPASVSAVLTFRWSSLVGLGLDP